MRVLIVCTAILAYANAAPSHLVPLAPLAVRTFAYPAAIPTISSGDIQAAAIDTHVKYADLAQAAVDKARQFSEQTVEDLNLKAYSNIAVNQEKVNEAYWSAEDKKWQSLDAIKTAEAQLEGALASNAGAWAKGAAGSPYVAAVAPYSAVASFSAVPTASSGDIQAAAIDAQVKYADHAQAAVDKARLISENNQAQWNSAIASNAGAWAKAAAGSPYVAAVAPYSAVASFSAVPTVSSGDIQAATIDAHVKYADLAQAAVDKARLISENNQAQLDSAIASNAAALAKGAAVSSFVAGVAPYSAVPSYSAVPTISSGDIQAAEIDAHVKYADLAQAAVDNARQISENTQAQWDSAIASNTAALDKGAAISSFVAGVAPYSAVPSYSAVPTITSGDIQAAEINARVKYADLAQAAVDKAKEISENNQAQLDSAIASNAAAFAKSTVAGPYVAAVAPYSAVTGYSGFVAPAIKSFSTQFHSESSKAEANYKAAEANVKAAEASVQAAEANVKSIETEKSEIQKSVKSAEAALESAKSEADKAFAALHTSPVTTHTVGLTSAYLTPSAYSSVAFGQPILNPLQHIAPVVGPTYLKTLC